MFAVLGFFTTYWEKGIFGRIERTEVHDLRK